MGGVPQKPRIISWRVGPLQYRLPPLGECCKNQLYQLVVLREAAFGFSDIFWKTLSTFAHFMMGDLGAHLPTLCCFRLKMA